MHANVSNNTLCTVYLQCCSDMVQKVVCGLGILQETLD